MYQRAGAFLLALWMALVCASPNVLARAREDDGPKFIRDAEIEGLLRAYVFPIFKVAGIQPGSVEVILIEDDRINAFVSGGQRIFVNTGLISQSHTPNEVIGVLAHETGHIAGGHLARIRDEMEKASAINIVGMMVGLAAMAGGAATNQSEVVQAGNGVMMGAQGAAQRNVLSYMRTMEGSADQAAIRYLDQTHQSGRGMITLFQKLSNESIASLRNMDPYVQSHPMPLDRIHNLERAARASPYFGKADPPGLVLRHRLAQAKLLGYIHPDQVRIRYPASDKSMPAHYARAIAALRKGDTATSVAIMDGLTQQMPQNPYFWELKGQALLEGGNATAALAPLAQAVKLKPDSGLLQILYAQALIGTEKPDNAKKALDALFVARKTEQDSITLYRQAAVAYNILGDIPRADLASAESAFLQGDAEVATERARRAQASLKKNSPEWTRANDILGFLKQKRRQQ